MKRTIVTKEIFDLQSPQIAGIPLKFIFDKKNSRQRENLGFIVSYSYIFYKQQTARKFLIVSRRRQKALKIILSFEKVEKMVQFFLHILMNAYFLFFYFTHGERAYIPSVYRGMHKNILNFLWNYRTSYELQLPMD